MNILKYLILLLLCLFSHGCEKQKKADRPPPSVLVGTVRIQTVPIYIDSIGQAVPTSTVPIRPQVGGKLIAAYVNEGDVVEEGQLLYTIDPRPFQDALDQAKAALVKDETLLRYAQKTEERYSKVVQEDYISKLSFEQYQTNTASAQAQVAIDQAAIALAELRLEFSRVTAPIAGKISNFNIYAGNIVIENDPDAITTIRPFSPIDVRFSLPQSQFELIRRSQNDHTEEWSFIAALPEDSKVVFEGKTFFIDNQLNQDTGTIFVKGRIPNLDRQIWPGAFLRVKVLQKSVPQALTVPKGAVLTGKNGPYLYRLDSENKVSALNVTIITQNEEYVAIESDALLPGDKVVTDGQINITPGMYVNPHEPL